MNEEEKQIVEKINKLKNGGEFSQLIILGLQDKLRDIFIEKHGGPRKYIFKGVTQSYLKVSSGCIKDPEFEMWLSTPNKCCYYKPCHKHISELAYCIWKKTGRDDAEANWLEAESILKRNCHIPFM